jgi:outer membrane protein OmpA-like peptidoglycan-associated protein
MRAGAVAGGAVRRWAAGLALAGLVAAGPVVPRAAQAQDPPRSEAPAEALPPEPPSAPPAPPRLAPEGAAMAPSSPAAGPPLPPGMAALPEGGVRIALGAAPLDPAQARALEGLGRAMAAIPAGRITIEAQVSGPANDVSMARRASLARAQAVKAALVAGGLPATRIDLRPLGRLPGAADRVDVLPPGVASPNAEGRGR